MNTIEEFRPEAEAVALAFGVKCLHGRPYLKYWHTKFGRHWNANLNDDDLLSIWLTSKGQLDSVQILAMEDKGSIAFYRDYDPFSEVPAEEQDVSMAFDCTYEPGKSRMVEGLINLGYNPDYIYSGLEYEPTGHERMAHTLKHADLTVAEVKRE